MNGSFNPHMPAETIRKIGVILALGLLTASAFFIRLENFKNSKTQSIDEVVYYRMAKQVLAEGLSGYNTVPYGRELAATGRPLPDYFFQPLFKYPPLFTFLLAASMKMFGGNALAAAYVPLFFSALTIPLTYLLGSLVFDRKAGLAASFLLWMDPVSIICAQKVWMETTLAFFTVLSVLFFITAIQTRKDAYFIAAGIACGLATLTKYPGIFCLLAYAVFISLNDRTILKKKSFLGGMSIPFIMLTPWLAWNFQVLGKNFVLSQVGLHSSAAHQKETAIKVLFILITIGSFYLIHRWKLKPLNVSIGRMFDEEQKMRLRRALAIALTIVLSPYIVRSLSPAHLPSVGWYQGMFLNEPLVFYLGRLIEFSLLYLLSFMAFVFEEGRPGTARSALKIAAGTLFGFYMFWGNYQSRYILAVIPLLLILAANMFFAISKRIWGLSSPPAKNAFLALFFLIAGHSLLKTNLINQILSFPHDFCYF